MSFFINTVDLVGTSHPSGKKMYGNFVSSDTLMPLKTALITPPKIEATTTTANITNTEVPPPPPPPFPIEARPVTKAASPPPPPPPPPPKLLPTVHQQIPTMHQKKPTMQQIPPTQKKTPPGVNPVVQAIVDNALGRLPHVLQCHIYMSIFMIYLSFPLFANVACERWVAK